MISFLPYSVTAVICVFGIIGNTLAFIGFHREEKRKKKKSTTAFLFQVLAVADNCLLLVTIITWFDFLAIVLYCYHQDIEHLNKNETLPTFRPYIFIDMTQDSATFIRQYVHRCHAYVALVIVPLSEMALLSTIIVTVVLAICRFIAVWFPFKACRWCTMHRTRLYVGIGIAFAILYNSGLIYNLEVNQTVYNRTTFSYITRRNGHVTTAFRKGIRPLVYFVIPVLLLTILTVLLSVKVKCMDTRRCEMASEQRVNNSVTRVLIAVLTVFCSCSLSWPLYIILGACGISQEIMDHLFTILYLFYVVNSSVNFVIYTFFNKHYRRILLKSCCFSSCKRDRVTDFDMQNGHIKCFDQICVAHI